MKKASSKKQADELRPEYDLSKLTGGVEVEVLYRGDLRDKLLSVLP